ncbi:MAG TPA: sigma-70 family RNA polymerase sigma factor [Polyangiaceae bacterium]|nr:sigma-70 family RNA polymerase sigma factor [Polyangiaceae bacterium]
MNRAEPRAELEEFERALLSHGSNLLAVATRLARNRAEAEDLVQDTLVKALRAKDQYEAGTNLKAWLLKILKNTFINRYRRSGLERNVLDGPDADPLADGWIGAATLRSMRDPEAQALRPILEREINDALDSIPEEFRLIVLLADVEELSYKEIADTVGCPIGTVMSRLHRGRRLLKTRLLEQARTIGISGDEPPRAEEAAPEPVKLDMYRAKRGGS